MASLLVSTILHWPEDKSQQVAAFNTNGWVKTRVVKNLVHAFDWALDGLYIRTIFPDYVFYPRCDSVFGDLVHRPELADNVPGLIAAMNDHTDAAGFNTEGWIKRSVKVPPSQTPAALDKPTRGLYVRVEWPGFVFLPFLDSPGNDSSSLGPDKSTWELIQVARNTPDAVAFNTGGYVKSRLVSEPVEVSLGCHRCLFRCLMQPIVY